MSKNSRRAGATCIVKTIDGDFTVKATNNNPEIN